MDQAKGISFTPNISNLFSNTVYSKSQIAELIDRYSKYFFYQLSSEKCSFTAELYNTLAPLINSFEFKVTVISKEMAFDENDFIHFPLLFHKIEAILNPKDQKPSTLSKIKTIGKYSIGALAPFLGYPSLGIYLLASDGYKALSSHLPDKITIEIEKKISVISHLFNFFTSNKILAASSALTDFPFAINPLYRQLDQKVASFFQNEIFLLSKIDQKPKRHNNFSIEKIEKILRSDIDKFRINISHCSTSILKMFNFETKANFKLLRDLFRNYDWTLFTEKLLEKLKTNKKFNTYIKKFSNAKNSTAHDFNVELANAAEVHKKTVNQFILAYFTTEFFQFVSILLDAKKIDGPIADIDIAKQYMSIIIPYLEKLAQQKSPKVPSLLMKIGLESFLTNTHDIKMFALHLLEEILLEKSDLFFNQKTVYEIKFFIQLQKKREQIYRHIYEKFIEASLSVKNKAKIPPFEKKVIESNVLSLCHSPLIRDVFEIFFKIGFYPLDESERNLIGLNEILIRSNPTYPFSKSIKHSYHLYEKSLREVFLDLTEIEFSAYMRKWILNNPEFMDDRQIRLRQAKSEVKLKLKEESNKRIKEELLKQLNQIKNDLYKHSFLQNRLLDALVQNNCMPWPNNDSLKPMHRLFLVLQGILEFDDKPLELPPSIKKYYEQITLMEDYKSPKKSNNEFSQELKIDEHPLNEDGWVEV